MAGEAIDTLQLVYNSSLASAEPDVNLYARFYFRLIDSFMRELFLRVIRSIFSSNSFLSFLSSKCF